MRLAVAPTRELGEAFWNVDLVAAPLAQFAVVGQPLYVQTILRDGASMNLSEALRLDVCPSRIVQWAAVTGSAPGKRKPRSTPAGLPFWITLALAAVLAVALLLPLDEAPPEQPAQVVLMVDGLH